METYLKAEAGPIDILLVAAEKDVTAVQTYLQSFPDIDVVNFFDARSSTPTLSNLQDYDAVLVWRNYGVYDPVALGDVLADYVDVGGGVVVTSACWAGGPTLQGRFMTEGYSPFVSTGSYLLESWADLGWYDTGHPIMAGVGSVSGYLRGIVNVADGAELVASWNDSAPFVATKSQVVGVALMPNIYGYGHDWTGDVPTLIHNSLVLTTAPIEEPAVSISTDSFEYCLGDTMTVTLDIANPTEDSITFEWYIGVPQLDIWVTYASTSIPAGFDNSYTIPIPVGDLGPTPFGLVHYVHMLDPVSGDVLVQDVALCAYSPGMGEAMPVDIEEEIMKTIERVGLPS